MVLFVLLMSLLKINLFMLSQNLFHDNVFFNSSIRLEFSLEIHLDET